MSSRRASTSIPAGIQRAADLANIQVVSGARSLLDGVQVLTAPVFAIGSYLLGELRMVDQFAAPIPIPIPDPWIHVTLAQSN
ncbi:hypothetical protein [Brevibacillus agri]|uniref:hypothetical protein n=1 Tax=Brevibacillus agri TaxID=51101 RepID=UPI003D1C9A51